MTKNITVIFDMDGTLANLYGVENWLNDLRNFNPRPYVEAGLMVADVADAITNLLAHNIEVKVVSWLSKGSTPDYDRAVRMAKREWLERHNIKANSIRLVPYGTEKGYYRNKNNINILVDDDVNVRNSFTRFDNCQAIDPNAIDMVQFLNSLVA